MLSGIDVSNYQSAQPDLSGRSFIVVKSTEGHTLINANRKSQAAWGRQHSCLVGWYHFLWPGGVQAQVDFFVHGNPAANQDPTPVQAADFIAVDFERTSAGSMASTADKNAMIRGLQAAYPHAQVGLYCNVTDWHNTDDFCGDFLWIADPSAPDGQPRVQHPWTFQQTAISGGTDVDAAHFDTLAQLQQWAHAKESDTMTLTDTDISKIADAVYKKLMTTDGVLAAPADASDYATNKFWTLQSHVQATTFAARKAATDTAAILAQLKALDPAALEGALVARIDGLKAIVTVTDPQQG
jgi:Glycosyl hydrolases family 25